MTHHDRPDQATSDTTIVATLRALRDIAATQTGFAVQLGHPDEPELTLHIRGGAMPKLAISFATPAVESVPPGDAGWLKPVGLHEIDTISVESVSVESVSVESASQWAPLTATTWESTSESPRELADLVPVPTAAPVDAFGPIAWDVGPSPEPAAPSAAASGTWGLAEPGAKAEGASTATLPPLGAVAALETPIDELPDWLAPASSTDMLEPAPTAPAALNDPASELNEPNDGPLPEVPEFPEFPEFSADSYLSNVVAPGPAEAQFIAPDPLPWADGDLAAPSASEFFADAPAAGEPDLVPQEQTEGKRKGRWFGRSS